MILIVLFSCGVPAQESIVSTNEHVAKLIDCLSCVERTVFLPEIIRLEQQETNPGNLNIISIELKLDESGEIISTRTIRGDAAIAKQISASLAAAQFLPKSENGIWVTSTLILRYRAFSSRQIPSHVVLNPFVSAMPSLEIPTSEGFGCIKQEIEVLVEFDRETGKILSSNAVSVGSLYTVYAEAAATKTKVVLSDSVKTEDSIGILIFTIPADRECYPVITLCNTFRKAVSLAVPEYSDAARMLNLKGRVNVGVLVDENGNVAEATVATGHPILRQLAKRAALTSTFEPHTLSGKPVYFRTVIVYNFR